MRLFIAIDFDRAAKDALYKAVEGLRARAAGGSFTRRENLHLTLAFIGETDRQTDLVRLVDGLRAPAFTLTLGALGCFGAGGIVYRRVDGGEALSCLHAELAQALSTAGFPVDRRPFSPHLTLGRGGRVDQAALGALSAAFPPLILRAGAVTLMKSERVRGVLTYTPLYVRRLLEEQK